MNLELNEVELYFLKRALEWRIQNIDYFIEKRKLEGLKKANQLSEKATLQRILEALSTHEVAKEDSNDAAENQSVPDDDNNSDIDGAE